MKCPASNLDLLMGERLTVPIDCRPECRGIRLVDGRLEKLPEKCGTANDPKGKTGGTRTMATSAALAGSRGGSSTNIFIAG